MRTAARWLGALALVLAAACAGAGPSRQWLLAVAQGGEAEWQLVDAAGGAPRRLARVAADAEAWAADPAAQLLVYAAGDAVWRLSWARDGAAAERLGPRPAQRPYAAWLDAASGEPRRLVLREPAAREARGMAVQPPDARPYWAELWALRRGTWVRLARRATAWGVDGSLGPAVFEDRWQERGRSARRVDDLAGCASLCDEDAAAPAGAAEAEGWRRLPGPGPAVLFGVALGERWQPVGPVVVPGGDGRPRALHPAGPAPLRLWRQGAHLVLWSATLPTEVVDIDLATGHREALGRSLTAPLPID